MLHVLQHLFEFLLQISSMGNLCNGMYEQLKTIVTQMSAMPCRQKQTPVAKWVAIEERYKDDFRQSGMYFPIQH